ncbi:MAG: nitroreductase [Syntrophales bacterium]
MNITEAIMARKSIRKFKENPIPKSVLKKILQIATRAPSAMNTQPWEFTVITGNALDAIREENVKKLHAGELPQPEHHIIGWPGDSIYRRRQVELGMALFQLMGIPRDDMKKRMLWTERGFRFFNAPAAIIISTDTVLGEEGPLLGLGAVMQTICLAALDYGLWTCIEDQGVMYPDVIRKYISIPDNKRIIVAVAIGYPDDDFPANRLLSHRDPVDDITSWYGDKSATPEG